MALSLAILLIAFGGLWLIPAAWITRGSTSAMIARRAGAVAALYTALLLFAAWWWYVPLGVQKGLKAFALSSNEATVRLDCTEVGAALDKLREAGRDDFNLADDGMITVKREIWDTLGEDQKNTLIALGRTVRNCSPEGSGSGSGPLQIKDAETGALLATG